MLETVATVCGGVMFLQWLHVIYQARCFEKMASAFANTSGPLTPSPQVSIVIPARNEAKHLERSLESLARQSYKNIEIILVNDRSTDNTGAIMERFSAKYKTKYIQVTQLPEGWLGKNYALQSGSLLAEGEYILFTDADIFFADPALERAVQVMEEKKLDHLVLAPKFICKGFILQTMQTVFSVIFLSIVKPSKIGKSPNYYIGAGAFNFLRRSFYEKIGRHETLRLEVIDDVMLGKRTVQNQGKLGFIDGKDLVSVEWYPSWPAMIRGLEKNGFAAFRYSLWTLLIVAFRIVWHHVLPYVGVVYFYFHFSAPAFWSFVAALVLSHLIFAVAAKKMGFSPLVTVFVPLAAFLIFYAHLRSTVLTLYRGEVRWRDTGYPLNQLKKHRA